MRFIARLTERGAAGRARVVAPRRGALHSRGSCPTYLRDPWEYDFSKLGSRGDARSPAPARGRNKADQVFGGKMNIAGRADARRHARAGARS